jgi:hypothetical protein
MAQNTTAWDKTFPKSDLVDNQKVTCKNRLGITLVTDLYLPKTLDRSVRHPAIIVGHPQGGVAECLLTWCNGRNRNWSEKSEVSLPTIQMECSFNSSNGEHYKR